jgi:hypothetical protein
MFHVMITRAVIATAVVLVAAHAVFALIVKYKVVENV